MDFRHAHSQLLSQSAKRVRNLVLQLDHQRDQISACARKWAKSVARLFRANDVQPAIVQVQCPTDQLWDRTLHLDQSFGQKWKAHMEARRADHYINLNARPIHKFDRTSIEAANIRMRLYPPMLHIMQQFAVNRWVML